MTKKATAKTTDPRENQLGALATMFKSAEQIKDDTARAETLIGIVRRIDDLNDKVAAEKGYHFSSKLILPMVNIGLLLGGAVAGVFGMAAGNVGALGFGALSAASGVVLAPLLKESDGGGEENLNTSFARSAHALKQEVREDIRKLRADNPAAYEEGFNHAKSADHIDGKIFWAVKEDDHLVTYRDDKEGYYKYLNKDSFAVKQPWLALV